LYIFSAHVHRVHLRPSPHKNSQRRKKRRILKEIDIMECMMMVLNVGNIEEENNSYVVFKMKDPWISWKIGWW
jgi:hypothetical protein